VSRTIRCAQDAPRSIIYAVFAHGIEMGVGPKGSVNNPSWYALDSTLALGVTGGSGRFRRLSANHCFAGKPNISRRRLLRLFIRVAMAGRLLLSQLHERSSLEIIAGTLALFWMSQASFRSGWDGFPRHTSADGNLVSSDVVYH